MQFLLLLTNIRKQSYDFVTTTSHTSLVLVTAPSCLKQQNFSDNESLKNEYHNIPNTTSASLCGPTIWRMLSALHGLPLEQAHLKWNLMALHGRGTDKSIAGCGYRSLNHIKQWRSREWKLLPSDSTSTGFSPRSSASVTQTHCAARTGVCLIDYQRTFGRKAISSSALSLFNYMT